MPRPSESSSALVLTSDPVLFESLVRLCAAASIAASVAGDETDPEPIPAPARWRSAAAVLVGFDRAHDIATSGLPRHGHLYVVAFAGATSDVWRSAIALHAQDAFVLPDEAARLTARLAEIVEGGGVDGMAIGFVGVRGGAGASTLATMVALVAARSDEPALLVDGDPSAGGIELILGWEDLPGPRWSQISSTQGRLSGRALRSALPAVGSLAVLSGGRDSPTEIAPERWREVIDAGRRSSRLVVADLQRYRVDEYASSLDGVVIVATSDLASVAGGRVMMPRLRNAAKAVGLVVRRRRGYRLDPDAVAESLELRLLGSVPTDRPVERAVENGLGPVMSRRLVTRVRDLHRAIVHACEAA